MNAVERRQLQRGLASLMDPTLLSVRSFRLGCAVSFLFVLGGLALQFIIPLSGIYFWHINTGAAGFLTALEGKGIKGQGLFVGGTEDWLDVPLPDQLLLESGFTSEVWFQREDWSNPYRGGSGFQTLVAVTSDFSQDITADGCALTDPWALVSTLSHRNPKYDESETVRVYTRPNVVQPGKWHHAASVFRPEHISVRTPDAG